MSDPTAPAPAPAPAPTTAPAPAATTAPADPAATSPVVAAPPAAPATPSLLAADPPPPEPVAPYVFKAPEGVTYDQAAVERYGALVQQLGVPNEAAQKILDGVQTQLSETKTAWLTQSKADKVLAGADGNQFDANIGKIKSALNQIGNPEFREVLTKSGLENNPSVLKFLLKVSESVLDDKVHGRSTIGGEQPRTFNELANAMYPRAVISR
jgi:hypothetical protein